MAEPITGADLEASASPAGHIGLIAYAPEVQRDADELVREIAGVFRDYTLPLPVLIALADAVAMLVPAANEGTPASELAEHVSLNGHGSPHGDRHRELLAPICGLEQANIILAECDAISDALLATLGERRIPELAGGLLAYCLATVVNHKWAHEFEQHTH